GDLGRHNMPVLRDPEVPSGINFMIIESTYGNRIHGDLSQTEQKLERVIKKAVDRGGKIIVPSFSVGRTQEFVYTLKRLMDAGRVPCIPVFVDSPLSANVTEIFRQHYECYDSQTRDLFLRGEDPFGFSCLEYVRNVERSKKLNTMKGPAIIISASGMCEAGRILHHLKNNIENEANIVLIVGFMAENTLGRNLVERKPEVRIFGESFRLNAEVVIMNEFSAHADAQDLENFTRAVASAGDLRRVFIVHGEPSQSEALAGRLEPVIPGGVILPEEGREYPLSS
ncbi:MAG TPA: MBL fold metallo-hydrolase, partial [Candidatus Sumerlaeota bacterium]|nr:MBL fold metallo-hydrolase [Candidatus Sumerlaeota bacterium]